MKVKVLKIRSHGDEDVVYVFEASVPDRVIIEKIKWFLTYEFGTEDFSGIETLDQIKDFCESSDLVFFDVFTTEVRS